MTIEFELSKKQSAIVVNIDLQNVNLITTKEEHIYLFYQRYLTNYENNQILLLDDFVRQGGNKDDFEMPPEVDRALIASFRRQLKRQYKVNLINEMISKNSFPYLNTVILQNTVKALFKNSIDKDFITTKIKENQEIYKKPRRNENLDLHFDNQKVNLIKEHYNKNVYVPMDEVKKISEKISLLINKNIGYLRDIEEEYRTHNPATKTV